MTDGAVNIQPSFATTGGGGGGGGAVLFDIFANIPAASSVTRGTMFKPTDGRATYVSTGTVWEGWIGSRKIVDPNLQSWSWDNQAGGSVDTSKGGIILNSGTATTTSFAARYCAAPAPPYRAEFAFYSGVNNASLPSTCGIAWRESSTGKFSTNQHIFNGTLGGPVPAYLARNYTTSSLFSANLTAESSFLTFMGGPLLWFAIEDDNTNRKYLVSRDDGKVWNQYQATPRTAFMTPDQVAFFVQSTSPNNTSMHLMSLQFV